MRRIRRKRARPTWMPILGGSSLNGDHSYGTTFFGSTIEADFASEGAANLYVTPVVPDYTVFPEGADVDPDGNPQTLADFTAGQDWLLKRIVGRLSVGIHLIDGMAGTTPAFIQVGAAFFVGRADDGNQDVPDTNNDEIDPLGTRNVRQPWIWRRTWLFHNGTTSATTPNSASGPIDNLEMPGALGPIIDTKIARRIRREERLFFVINAYGGDDYALTLPFGGSGYTNPGLVDFNLDYRILGMLTKSTNRSSF